MCEKISHHTEEMYGIDAAIAFVLIKESKKFKNTQQDKPTVQSQPTQK